MTKLTVEHSSTLRCLKSMHVISILIIIFIGIIFYLQHIRDEETYFFIAPNGKIKQAFPLSVPNVSTNTLLNWATLAVVSSYTMDFHNYRNTIKNIKHFFTKLGYENFMQSLENKNRLNDIIKQKLTVTAVLNGTPVIIQEGPQDNKYKWTIQFPIEVTYQGASLESTEQQLTITMVITRVPTIDNNAGIGIEQILAVQGGLGV